MMKKLTEKFRVFCTAVSFAEHGEWDDAVSIADGSFKLKGEDGRQIHAPKKRKKKYIDNRPRLKL